MELIGLLLVIVLTTAIAQNSSNISTTSSTPPSSAELLSQNKLESKIFQVSPGDIQNNTAQYVRSESGLNRFLALSNTPKLQANGGPDTELKKTLTIDNLANLGVEVTEPNVLANFNNLNSETKAKVAIEPLLNHAPSNQLDLNALQTQSVNDFLKPNSLFSQYFGPYQQEVNTLTKPFNVPNQYEVAKVLKSPGYTTLLTATDNAQLQSSVQSLLNQQPQVSNLALNKLTQLPTQTLTGTSNDQLLNSLQTLLNQSPSQTTLSNMYQTPSQYQSLLSNNDQSLNLLQSLLGQQIESNQLSLSSLLEMIKKNSNPEQPLDLESLLSHQMDQPDQFQVNPYDSLTQLVQPTTNVVTQVVFKNHVPNLHNENCKSAFGALLQNAYVQYLKLARFPYCQQSDTNQFPSMSLPFEINVVPSKPVEKPNDNSALLKILWFLLNKLKNQHVSPNPPDSSMQVLLEILQLNHSGNQPTDQVSFPDIIEPIPDPSPNRDTAILVQLLKLLKNPSQNPYLFKIILEILKKKSPDNELPLPDNWDVPYDQFPQFNPHPKPSPAPIFPLPETHPTPDPTFSDHPELSTPSAKYVILVFKKYLPEKTFTVSDILYLVKLVNTLPKTLPELLLNPELLKQVILQLSYRNLNPKLVLSIIYNHLIQLSNQNALPDVSNFVNPELNSRVVVLKYQVKRQTPFVYQPYYYLLYKLPFATFVKHLYQLLLAKPYLKQNRVLLLKELLVSALSNSKTVSSDFSSVSKDNLVKLIANQGATPLDVKVVSESNVLSEELKVIDDLNSQFGTDSTFVSQLATNSGVSDPSDSNSWAYLLNQISGLAKTPLNAAEMTTVNPILQLLGRNENSLQKATPFSIKSDAAVGTMR